MIKRKNGFSILGVILVVVAVIVAIGIWALSGQANTSDNSANVKPLASAILNDSSSIKASFDKILIDGGSASSVVFQPALQDKNNILDPNDGITNPSQGKALIEGVAMTSYVFNRNTNFTGGSSKKDITIMLAGIRDSVCKEINSQVNGTAEIPVFAPIGDYYAFISGASASDPNSNVQLDMTTALTTRDLNWSIGCIKGASTYDGNNIFFRVLKVDFE